MSRLTRIYDDQSQYFFITTKTYRNRKIFRDERKVKLLLQCISYLKKRKYFKLFAWVILFDHLHLLLEITGKKNISEIMHDFKSYTVNQISVLTRRQGFHALPFRKESRSVEASATDRKYLKIWQTSFYDHIIRDEQDFRNHLDYIHYNPVKHQYMEKPEDWRWSSYPAFLERGYYVKGWGYDVKPKNLYRLNLE